MIEETKTDRITNWGTRGWCAFYGLSPKNGLGEGRPLDLSSFSSLLVTDLDYFIANTNEIRERVIKLIAQRDTGTKPLVYVVSPYQEYTKEDLENAEKVSIELIKRGFDVITPHKNTAGYERYEDGNITRSTWLNMDLNILSRCDAIIILRPLEVTPRSVTLVTFAKEHNIPVIRINEMEEDVRRDVNGNNDMPPM